VAHGNLLRLEELGDHVVQVPRAARDVEDRIARARFRCRACAACFERAVERSHARKRKSRASILQQHQLRGAQEVGHLGLQHGVIHVADDAELCARWRREDRRHGHGALGAGFGDELQLRGVPRAVRERRRQRDPLVQKSLVVGRDAAQQVAEAHTHLRVRHRIALDAPQGVEQVAPA
jgi:hypothetical protein